MPNRQTSNQLSQFLKCAPTPFAYQRPGKQRTEGLRSSHVEHRRSSNRPGWMGGKPGTRQGANCGGHDGAAYPDSRSIAGFGRTAGSSRQSAGGRSGNALRKVIALSPEASEQIDALERFYIENDARRRSAILATRWRKEASLVILHAPERGQPFPRPYPRTGVRWPGMDQTGSVLGCL